MAGSLRSYEVWGRLHHQLTDHYGLAVVQAINITDIDDKIAARAAEQGTTVRRLSRHWEAEFKRDMARLGVREPSACARFLAPHEVQCMAA
jgi:cysteinyl-tRNA synthetase